MSLLDFVIRVYFHCLAPIFLEKPCRRGKAPDNIAFRPTGALRNFWFTKCQQGVIPASVTVASGPSAKLTNTNRADFTAVVFLVPQ